MNRFSAWVIAFAACIVPAAAFGQTLTGSGAVELVLAQSTLVHPVQASVTSGGSPLAGVPVTFTAPAAGPSLVFANGLRQITVATDAAGIARAGGTTNDIPGEADITADIGGGPMVAASIVIAGPFSMQFGTPIKAVYGAIARVDTRIAAPWFPCGLAAHGPQLLAGGTVQIRANGSLLGDPSITMPTTCTGGVYQMFGFSSAVELEAGTYVLSGIYFPPAGLRAVTAANVNLLIEGFDVAAGNTTLHIGFSRPVFASSHVSGRCGAIAARAGAPGDAGFPSAGPPGVDLPFALLHIDATDCSWMSDTPTVAAGPLTQRVLLGIDAPLGSGTAVWAYGPTSDAPTPHWYALRAAVSGGAATFDLVDGATGDDSSEADGELHPTIALTRSHDFASPGSVGGLWWGGPAESGWGLTLTQHEERLFAALFIYDAQGDPRWLVMPSGQWNAAHTVYTGNLYRPRGAPYTAYSARFLVPGSPVGTATFTFASLDALTFDYTVDGAIGRKSLMRQPIGPAEPLTMPPVEDLWWGGEAQNGWGFALAQQYRTAFGVLFTYDEHGDTTWFVAPSFTWRGANTPFTSNLFRTHGSPWLGVPYDPSALTSKTIGSATLSIGVDPGTLKFNVDDRAFTYPLTPQPF